MSSGSEVHRGKINPCNLDPSSKIISSCLLKVRSDTGAFRKIEAGFIGHVVDFLISSAFNINALHFRLILAFSTLPSPCFETSIYNSIAAIATFRASSLELHLSILNSVSWLQCQNDLFHHQDRWVLTYKSFGFHNGYNSSRR